MSVVIPDNQIEVRAAADGVWVELKASDGKSFAFHVENMFVERGGVSRMAIRQWQNDMQEKGMAIRRAENVGS